MAHLQTVSGTYEKEGLKDVNELQSYLIHRIEVFLNAHGRKLLGWDEILKVVWRLMLLSCHGVARKGNESG